MKQKSAFWTDISQLHSLSKRIACGASGRFFYVQVFVAFVLITILASQSSTLALRIPFLLWLRGDACAVWRDSKFSASGDYTWWQRACMLERDWVNIDYQCKDVRFMGNYPICLDPPFNPLKMQNKKPCIVYSFGIANDFRFDDALALYNCTVYSFDPSMGVQDHQHARGVFFKNLGIGTEDNDHFSPRVDSYVAPSDEWKIRKLSSIMKMLGHTIESISLIKLDVENNEWAVLSNMLEEGILQRLPQILVEWHIFTDSPPRSMYRKMHEDYSRMKALGFKKFWMRNEGRNHWLPKMTTQAETAYVNTEFKP